MWQGNRSCTDWDRNRNEEPESVIATSTRWLGDSVRFHLQSRESISCPRPRPRRPTPRLSSELTVALGFSGSAERCVQLNRLLDRILVIFLAREDAKRLKAVQRVQYRFFGVFQEPAPQLDRRDSA